MSYIVDAEKLGRIAIIVQPRRSRVDGSSYLRTQLQLDQHEMTTMNVRSRANYCFGLCNTSMLYEFLSAGVAELFAPGTSAADRGIVEKVIRNADPLRGRVGANLAG
eukprot:4341812-Pyramimonas_sp.AAC.1